MPSTSLKRPKTGKAKTAFLALVAMIAVLVLSFAGWAGITQQGRDFINGVESSNPDTSQPAPGKPESTPEPEPTGPVNGDPKGPDGKPGTEDDPAPANPKGGIPVYETEPAVNEPGHGNPRAGVFRDPVEVDDSKKVLKDSKKAAAESLKNEPSAVINVRPKDNLTDATNPVSTKKLPANSVAIPRLKTLTTVDLSYGKVTNKKFSLPNSVSFVKYAHGADWNDTKGTIMMASHVNYKSNPGPLKNAWKMKAGDKVYTTDGKGKTRAWKLYKVEVKKKQALPKDIFTRHGDNRLVLVTCGGKLVDTDSGRHFESNVILYLAPTK